MLSPCSPDVLREKLTLPGLPGESCLMWANPTSMFGSGMGTQLNSDPWDARFLRKLLDGKGKKAFHLFRESNWKSCPAFLWLVPCKRMTGTASAISALRRGQPEGRISAKRWGQAGRTPQKWSRSPTAGRNAGFNCQQPETDPWPARFRKPINSLFCLSQFWWELLQLEELQLYKLCVQRLGTPGICFLCFSLVLHIFDNAPVILSSVRTINIILSSPFKCPTLNIFLDYLYQIVYWVHHRIEKSVFCAEPQYSR